MEALRVGDVLRYLEQTQGLLLSRAATCTGGSLPSAPERKGELTFGRHFL